MSILQRGVGYNWSVSYSSDRLKADMEAYIRDKRPAVMLIFDRDGDQQDYVVQLAVKYGMYYPLSNGGIGYRPNGTFFVYRRWLPSPHNSQDGDNTQLWCSPQELCDKHMRLRNTGIPFLCNNEPNHSDLRATSAWHIAVMKEAQRRGLKVAVGGYAYGHPENHLDYSIFDDMIREINRGGHVLDLHEYVLGGTVFNDVVGAFDNERPETWPTVVPKEQRWRLGRFIWWMEHLKRKNIALPKFYIGEWGWATRPDMPHEWLRNVMPTWKTSNRERFLAEQLKWAWRVLYRTWGNCLGVCLFTINDGGQWPFSNFLDWPEARRLMSEGFDLMASTPVVNPPAFKPFAAGTYRLDDPNMKMRVKPTTASNPELAIVLTGTKLTILPDDAVTADGYTWQKVKWGAFEGWIATSIVKLTKLADPPAESEAQKLLREIDDLQAQIDERQTQINLKLARLKTLL